MGFANLPRGSKRPLFVLNFISNKVRVLRKYLASSRGFLGSERSIMERTAGYLTPRSTPIVIPSSRADSFRTAPPSVELKEEGEGEEDGFDKGFLLTSKGT